MSKGRYTSNSTATVGVRVGVSGAKVAVGDGVSVGVLVGVGVLVNVGVLVDVGVGVWVDNEEGVLVNAKLFS